MDWEGSFLMVEMLLPLYLVEEDLEGSYLMEEMLVGSCLVLEMQLPLCFLEEDLEGSSLMVVDLTVKVQALERLLLQPLQLIVEDWEGRYLKALVGRRVGCW